MDWQRNDCLGRQWHLRVSKHRCQILRRRWSSAKSDAHSYGYSERDAYTYRNCYADGNTYVEYNSNSNSNDYSKPNAEFNHPALHGQMFTYPEAATYSSSSAIGNP